MAVPFDPTVLTDELADLRRRVEDQAAELAALRERPTGEGPLSRRGLLLGLAGAGAAGVAALAGAAPASAATGDALTLGQANDADQPTSVKGTSLGGTAAFTGNSVGSSEVPDPGGGAGAGLKGLGFTGVAGVGAFQGVVGLTNSTIIDVGGAGVVGWAKGNGAGGAFSSSHGPTIVASSAGDGVTLRLRPAARTGPPTSTPASITEYGIGSISIDDAGELWLCVESGAPGTWTRLLRDDTSPGRIVPVAPFRALDTRASGGRPAGAPAIPGQVAGPLHAGQTVTLDLAGTGPLPDAISAVVGNVTVVSPNYAGFLRAFPDGSPSTTSAVNFTSGAIVGNGFTCGLGPNGLSLLSPAPASRTYHLVADITAYIT